MQARAFITGIGGLALSSDEREFIRIQRPWGLILFKRNIETPAQVASVVRDFRYTLNEPDAPVLIDQEGGRVQRLGPPHWPKYPPAAAYTQRPAAARLGARLIAADLHELGITVDCLPVADVPAAQADPVIGDRAYAAAPELVAIMARAA